MNEIRREDGDTSAGIQDYLKWRRGVGTPMTDVDDVAIDAKITEEDQDGDHCEIKEVDYSQSFAPLAFIEVKPLGKNIEDEFPRGYLLSLSNTKNGYVNGPNAKIRRLFQHFAKAFPSAQFWIVVPDFRQETKWFFVYDFRKPKAGDLKDGWLRYSELQYTTILRALHKS